ncbi:MAG TPA: RHS repeat-associated core domain-containing protein, partial [Sedimentisphaerales bacterium]|nr:RHS repeat-associated core domain-containing protein [Sedimentisphaerales bacterium]
MYSRTIQSNTTAFSYNGHLMDTASGGETFTLGYDENGNMLTSDSATLVYNWDNMLRCANSGGKSIALKYDPDGNRVSKQSAFGLRKFIVDAVGGLPTILLEIDASDNSIDKTYIYANDQVIAQHDGDYSDDLYFYMHDRLGSVRQMIDTGANVVNNYTYNPFGETFVSEVNETVENPFQFTGQYFDYEINEYYLRARQFDPHLGRFTTRDPVRIDFERPLSIHKYLYCENDPLNKVDPFGL